MSVRPFALLAVASLIVACSDSSVDRSEDAGPDARDIGTWDTSSDAATDRDSGGRDPADADADGSDVRDADTGDTEDRDGDSGADDTTADTADDAGPTGIGPEGGVVAIPGVTLVVPAGALDRYVEITIAASPTAVPEGLVRDTVIFQFEPDDTTFAIPFEVCFDLDGVRPANMAVFWTDEDGTGVTPIPSIDRPRQVCGFSDHFSLGFVGAYNDLSCDAVDCAPRPGSCDGGIASYPALAVCRDGECFAPNRIVDCEAAGATCVGDRCSPVPVCGNGVREAGEECDGSAVPARCSDLGYTEGTLGCTDACVYDETTCSGDPCGEVVCAAPDDPFCVGEAIVTLGEGDCSRGECSYSESRTDCRDERGVCLDGACVPGPAPGDVTITEVMVNPEGNDAGMEWFELQSRADHGIGLRGLVVSDDGTDSFAVGTALVLAPGEHLVFGASAAAAPVVDFAWDEAGRAVLANHADEIVLTFQGVEIGRLEWDDGGDPAWTIPEAAALSLDPDADSADSPSSWCAARAGAYDGTNRGTPGAENLSCAGICGDGLLDADEECDDGNLLPDDGCSGTCALEFDPCEAVSCATPPRAECDEDVAVTYADVGVCDLGSCRYEASETDCAVDGLVCGAGRCVAVRTGDLVITEFLANPAGDDNDLEWFEVYNPSPTDVAIDGLVISDDGTDELVISGDLVVPSGEWFVFGEHTDAVPGGVDVDWSDFGAITLGNDADEIVLTLHGIELDRVAYGDSTEGWAVTSGASTALSAGHIDTSDNDDRVYWCPGTADYGVPPNLGSPGAANSSCGECGDGTLGGREQCDDGNTSPGDGCAADCTLEECVGAEDCTSPPDAGCEGTVAVTWEATGICVVGVCAYAEAGRTECADADLLCYRGDCVDAIVTEGDVVVTEYLADPTGLDGGLEWFEVTNTTESDIDLTGLVVSDLGIDDFTVSDALILTAGDHIVFGASSSAAAGAVDFVWTGFALSNRDDEIILVLDDIELDRIEYDPGAGWPSAEGASATLDPTNTDAAANDDAANWCTSATPFGDAGERGTPGAANDACTD